MRDFKEEAADYCDVLDNEDGSNRGVGQEDDDQDEDDFLRRRKESEEFHQLEAHFRGKGTRVALFLSDRGG